MENAPDFELARGDKSSLAESATNQLLVQIGQSFATDLVIRNQDTKEKRLTFEVTPPAFTQAGQETMKITTIFGTKTTEVEVDFNIVDDVIVLGCSGECLAPSYGASPFTAYLVNLPVDDALEANDLSVTFDGVRAVSVDVQSANSSHVVLSVTPPDCADCDQPNAELTVDFRVEIRKGIESGVGATTDLTYVPPPKIASARFRGSGVSIVVLFDTPTNRAGMTSQDCAEIVQADSLATLGTAPVCGW
eukprot:3345489-Rhodomonas_salina.1